MPNKQVAYIKFQKKSLSKSNVILLLLLKCQKWFSICSKGKVIYVVYLPYITKHFRNLEMRFISCVGANRGVLSSNLMKSDG